MNGAEHYKQAEALLRRADEADQEFAMYLVGAAQVHATLAHTAATMTAQLRIYDGDNEDWEYAIAGPKASHERAPWEAQS